MSATQEQQTTHTITRRWKLAGPPANAAPAGSAVLIETDEHTSAGLLLVELALRGLEVTNVRLERGEALPAADSVGCAVVVGGDEISDALDPALIAWIAQADAAGATIFAVGSGAEALARALGGDSVGAAETDDGPRVVRIGRHVGVGSYPDTTPELIREWVPAGRQLFDLNEATVLDLPTHRPAEHRLFAAFVDGALAA